VGRQKVWDGSARVPAGHCVQAVELLCAVTVSPEHAVHGVLPVVLKVPGWQTSVSTTHAV
jgi:hypothetical protein